jgi:hypothetical protein
VRARGLFGAAYFCNFLSIFLRICFFAPETFRQQRKNVHARCVTRM